MIRIGAEILHVGDKMQCFLAAGGPLPRQVSIVKDRRVVCKIEWHPDQLFPAVEWMIRRVVKIACCISYHSSY